MFKYAVLDAAEKVIGISNVTAEISQPEMVLLIPGQDVQAGDLYDRRYGSFIRPVPVTPPPPPKISETVLPRKITVNAFRSRFLPTEELAFEMALESNATLRLLDKRLQAVVATHVDLDDPIYSDMALPALVAAGIVTQSRADAILGAAVQWHELPIRIQDEYKVAGYDIDV
ncbi:MAG: hypothetical protein U5L02_06450 [Rheinheimera sp.]|nr:hypothetical protein [Rheinheimera sp.]